MRLGENGATQTRDIFGQTISRSTTRKYHNQITEIDGERFDSKKEANRWCELKLMEKAGLITGLSRQVRFELVPSQRDADGKLVARSVSYIADFVYSEGDTPVVEDVKSDGTRTDVYRIKRALMYQRYGIQIREV